MYSSGLRSVEVHIHEGNFPRRSLLLFANLVWDVGHTVFFESMLDDVDGSHESLSFLHRFLCRSELVSLRAGQSWMLMLLRPMVAGWLPPLIDTGPADGHNPPLTSFFHHNSLAERIFRRDHFPTLGIRTGGDERSVLVRACHFLFSAL